MRSRVLVLGEGIFTKRPQVHRPWRGLIPELELEGGKAGRGAARRPGLRSRRPLVTAVRTVAFPKREMGARRWESLGEEGLGM